MSHIKTVQEIYGAFGRGDVATILSHLTEDVDWDYGLVDGGVPWLKPRRGHAQVGEFFQALGALDFTKFETKTFLESGNLVVVLVDLGIVVKSTGKSAGEENEVHIWHFNDQGLVSRFTHKLDTYQHWAALQTN